VRVPRYLFKLVYDATTGRSWAHWQENREGERVSAPISYRELVRRTGVEFLPTAGRWALALHASAHWIRFLGPHMACDRTAWRTRL